MILTDHEIQLLTAENNLLENFDPDGFTNIGYDLRTEYFVYDQKEAANIVLKCGESVFIGTKETIKLPNNIAAKVVLKNSRIRQGLTLDAPIYQPGHYTRVFFRVTNVSNDEIELHSNEKYATIIFEMLHTPAHNPYTGAFSNEISFAGMGQYTGIYQKEIHKIEKKTEDLKSMERSIYANVLVILTVFVALFSFLTTNLSLLSASANIAQFLY